MSDTSTHSARVAILVLAVLAVLYTVHIAREVLLPITLAIIFALLLAPLVKQLEAFRIPRALSSVLLIGTGLIVFGTGIYLLSSSAMEWLLKLPEAAESLKHHLVDVQREVKEVDSATRNIESLTDQVGMSSANDANKVVITEPGLRTELWIGLRNFFMFGALSIMLLFFLLSSGESLLRRAIETLPRLEDKKKAVHLTRHAHEQMSRYLVTVTAVNCAMGLITALSLWAMGFPDPALWGVSAAALRFVPYLGVSSTVVLLTVVGAVSFESLWYIAAAPLGYLLFASFVGQVVDPLVHGYRFQLNPIVVFLWIFFWGWLWGAPGVLLAVPLLTLFQVICQHSSTLSPLAHIIGDS
ncbi:AI-2E family transporter [Litorivivens sp.]|uniref:AI-2E family transporter n=1 Tax=Litorivivens sp. TaxID=2020868 RepID=UPI0035629D75